MITLVCIFKTLFRQLRWSCLPFLLEVKRVTLWQVSAALVLHDLYLHSFKILLYTVNSLVIVWASPVQQRLWDSQFRIFILFICSGSCMESLKVHSFLQYFVNFCQFFSNSQSSGYSQPPFISVGPLCTCSPSQRRVVMTVCKFHIDSLMKR